MFTTAEMRVMQSVLERHPSVTVVLDEVYSAIVFDSNTSVSLVDHCAALRERTIVLSSAGKTFSVTGWKIGWALVRKCRFRSRPLTPLSASGQRCLSSGRPTRSSERLFQRLHAAAEGGRGHDGTG